MKPDDIRSFLLQSDSGDESPQDTSSEDENDFVSEPASDYDPNSSSGASMEISETLDQNTDEVLLYPSKNGKYLWSETSTINKIGRLSKADVINLTPGPTRYAISRADDIKSVFLLFMPSDIMKLVVDMTNLQGQSVFGNNWIAVDDITIEAYIGLLLLAGVFRSHGEALESLWDE